MCVEGYTRGDVECAWRVIHAAMRGVRGGLYTQRCRVCVEGCTRSDVEGYTRSDMECACRVIHAVMWSVRGGLYTQRCGACVEGYKLGDARSVWRVIHAAMWSVRGGLCMYIYSQQLKNESMCRKSRLQEKELIHYGIRVRSLYCLYNAALTGDCQWRRIYV